MRNVEKGQKKAKNEAFEISVINIYMKSGRREGAVLFYVTMRFCESNDRVESRDLCKTPLDDMIIFKI
jgi:hypothetical protein